MKHWRWLLPLGQLALVLACHVYEPHEYRATARRDGAVNNIEYTFQHTPAGVAVISRGINFPALVLAYPFRNEGQAIYERNGEYTLVWIGINDVAFFLGVVLFWYWFAAMMGRNETRNPGTAWTRNAKIGGLACGALFGCLAGAYSIQMFKSHWHPDRQIGAFGALWAFALIAYFTSRLTREFSSRSRGQRSP